MENENRISIMGIISQIIMIIILIVVLILLFNNGKFMNLNTNTNKSANEILLNQNLMAMKDAAREYFTVNKMPKGEEEIVLTLREMYEKQIIVPLVDGNMNECNAGESLIKVKKVGTEFEIKVILVCGGVKKTIVSSVGCYDFCNGNNCDKVEKPKPSNNNNNNNNTCTTINKTKYEYAKKTEGSKTWGPFSEWTKVVHYASSTKKVETKTETECNGEKEVKTPAIETVTYSCPSGYTMSSDKKTCSKYVTGEDRVAINKNTTYSCPSGYTMSSDKKTCTKTVTDTVSRTSSKSCSSGYTLTNGTCQKKLTIDATPHVKVSFECPEGVCQTVSTVDYYYCSDSSYKLSGKTCYKYTTKTPTVNYSCPTGYKVDGTNCVKSTTTSTCSTQNVSYSCTSGYSNVSNSYCVKDTSGYVYTNATPNYKYSCTKGTLNNKECITKEKVFINVTYYRYSLLNTVQGSIVTKWSYSNNDKTLIDNGYKLTGNTKTEKVKNCTTTISK